MINRVYKEIQAMIKSTIPRAYFLKVFVTMNLTLVLPAGRWKWRYMILTRLRIALDMSRQGSLHVTPDYLVTVITGQGLRLLIQVIDIQQLQWPREILLPVTRIASVLLLISRKLASVPLTSINPVNVLRLRPRGWYHLLHPHSPSHWYWFAVIVKWIG